MNTTQETIEMTPEIRVVMGELGLPASSIAVGIAKGYEAQLIDPMGPVEAGNVIWAKGSHIRALRDWADGEIAATYADTKAKLVTPIIGFTKEQMDEAVRKASAPPSDTKGRDAYERRVTGEKWSAIGPYSIGNAKSYARAHGKAWPPCND